MEGKEKLSQLMAALGAGEEGAGEKKIFDAVTATGGAETLADDVDLPEEVQANIKADEELVREALALFEVDYDALIKMDGKSIYARAVAAQPQLLEGVLASKRPVLSALKIAVDMKPYVTFLEQYGESPEAIRAAIRQEVFAEMEKEKPSVNISEAEVGDALPFANAVRSRRKGEEGRAVPSLSQIFEES